MDTDKEEELNALTRRIIGCAYQVHNTLGWGFLEKVYENAMAIELRNIGMKVVQQQKLDVWYRDAVVGEYVADLIVEDRVLVELKAIKALDEVHAAQAINYLAATRLPICLLINFAQRVEVKRFRGPQTGPAIHSASVSICAPSVANKLCSE